MTELAQRQLHDRIVRSLQETGRRMAERYRGVAPDQPAPEPRRRERPAAGFSEDAGPGPRARPRP